MAKRPVKSETALLEQWRVALQNAQAQSEINTRIADFGYNATKLQEGQTLWDSTKSIWDTNKQLDLQKKQASNNFKEQRNNLYNLYSTHRKKAKAKFKREPQILEQLQIATAQPTAYLNLLQTIKHFYNQVAQNEEISTQLQSYNIEANEFETANTLISNTETTRAEYLKNNLDIYNTTNVEVINDDCLKILNKIKNHDVAIRLRSHL
jgi:predicted DNA-binding protein (MmcQ/YjbR family)